MKKDEKKSKKNLNKNNSKKVDNKKNKVTNKTKSTKSEKAKVENVAGNRLEIKKVIRIVIWIAIIFAFFYCLTIVITGDFGDEKEDEEVETSIQYDEILAGSSFKMNASKYLVVYYDSSLESTSELMNAVYTYKYSTGDTLKLYTVDLNNMLNQHAVAKDSSNKNPKNASELSVKAPTLIRFRDGKVREYIEGNSSIIKYLTN